MFVDILFFYNIFQNNRINDEKCKMINISDITIYYHICFLAFIIVLYYFYVSKFLRRWLERIIAQYFFWIIRLLRREVYPLVISGWTCIISSIFSYLLPVRTPFHNMNQAKYYKVYMIFDCRICLFESIIT